MSKTAHLFTTTVLALAVLAAPVSAFEIVNDEPEPAKIFIEHWVQTVRSGKTARFRPHQNPTLIIIELSHISLQCEAGENDRVRLADNNCYVNGELAGEGRFRM